VALKEGYYYVGGMLRDELIKEIDALGWEGEDAPRAAKIKRVLQLAAPQLFDVQGWDWVDFDFLKTILVEGVKTDFENLFGFPIGNTPIGRQIRALREKL